MQERTSWGTRLGFIFSTLGAAVGCGNLWRFPYLVGMHGGAVFLFAYLLIVAIIVYPIFTLEVALGRSTQLDPVGAYRSIAPGKPWFLAGYLNVGVALFWIFYLMPIFGWLAAYLLKFATGTFDGMSPPDIAAHFSEFLTHGNYIFALSMIMVVIAVLVAALGVRNGLERANNVFMPLLVVLLAILCIRGLTLPGAEAGLRFYLVPDFSKFTMQSLLAAMGQAFFSVGVAAGFGIVFGSYLPRDGSPVSSKTLIVCIGDTMIAFMAGLLIFPSIFSFGLEPNSGAGLLFVTLPNVFNNMPMGKLFAVMTVMLFLLAVITSQIACMETVVCFMQDNFKISRKKGLVILVPVVTFFVYLNSVSGKVFDWFDWVTTNLLLCGGALAMSIFIGWVWGIDRACDAAGITKHRWLWALLIKYVSPISIVVIWMTS